MNAFPLAALITIMPNAGWRANACFGFLQEYLPRFGIDAPLRQAAFLAQVAEESGELVYRHELWGPTAAQTAYEGRLDLGNTQPGDGFLFRGRGLLQITGRANYGAVSAALDVDFIRSPQLIETWEYATASAAWFWRGRGLNELADKSDFHTITLRINGGLTHFDRRCGYYERAKGALGIA